MGYLECPGRRRPRLIAVGVLLAVTLSALASMASAAEETPAPATVRRVLLIQASPRTAPALLAQEQAFVSTLRAALPGSVTFHSEYLELTMFDQLASFEEERQLSSRTNSG